MTTHRSVHRTAAGILWPGVCLLIGVAGPMLAWVLAPIYDPESWKSFRPEALAVIGFACALLAIVIELEVRRQISLARFGTPARGIVDEVYKNNLFRRDDNRIDARFHFTTPDGKLIDAKALLDTLDANALQRGSAVEVLYDANNPKRNAVVNSLWAVTWEERQPLHARA
jgi:hypothetical protein